MINTEHLVSTLKCLLLLRWDKEPAGPGSKPCLNCVTCPLPWMERAHNTTGTEEHHVRVGGEEQKFCALACS